MPKPVVQSSSRGLKLSIPWLLCRNINIKDSAVRCHACQTTRKGGAGGHPIVDLTEICSPKPTANGVGNNFLNVEGGKRGGDMESNRSRRRRRMEEDASSTSNNNHAKNDNSYHNNGAIDLTNDDSTTTTKTNNTNNTSSARSNISSYTNKSTKSSKSNHWGEKNGGDNRASIKGIARNERKEGGESSSNADILADPVPRRKVPLNMNGDNNNYHDMKMSSTNANEPVKRKKESKLKKKRKVDDNSLRMKSEEGDESSINESKQRKKQYTDDRNNKSSGESRLTDFYNSQKPSHVSFEGLLERANVILKQTFKHNSLRPLQESAVKNALQQKSSIVIMATGGGKSICYQLPALVGRNNDAIRAENSSVTIVVCPLIALMIDQVNNLHRKGVRTAACISSSHTAKAKQETLNRLQADTKNGKKKMKADAKLTPIQLLYCTPELIETERFRTILTDLYRSNRLGMFAIDEAHCLSTWGHDFRPAFRKLTWLREAFPDVPVMACTGTATAKVVLDIREILQLDRSVPCIMGTFNRQNISYEVRFKDSLNALKPQGAIADLLAVVKKQHDAAKNQPCSGIIYVHKRQDCESLAKQISKATGLACLAYHAGLKNAEREATQRKWTDGTCSIAVATVAFGMGIDLPHVRYVIHWTIAKSLDGFYQESGRGGRDGKAALSIVYYSKDDAGKFSFLLKMNAENAAKKKGKQNATATQQVDHSLVELEGMVNYCTTAQCKRKYVLGHFGEQIEASAVCKRTCDFCIDPNKVERDIKASECMSTVVNSHVLLNEKPKGKKFHHNPLYDEESLEDDDGTDDFIGEDDGLLGITNYAGEDELPSSDPKPQKGGFVKASSVLGKYEKLECQEGKTNGFVNFKTRTFNEPTEEDVDAKKKRAISVPEHLRKGLPDPFASKKAPNKTSELKSSSSYASASERIKAELAELQKQKEALKAKMGGSFPSRNSSTSKALPTPSLSFKKRC